MTIWKSVYENRFPVNPKPGQPTVLSDFRAAPGKQVVEPSAAHFLPGFTPDNQGLSYTLDTPLDKVIGLDVQFHFIWASLDEYKQLSLFSIEDTVMSASFLPETSNRETSVKMDIGSLLLTLGNAQIRVPNLKLSVPHLVPIDSIVPYKLHLRWYTNGQFHVWLDDKLISYHNNISAGNAYNLNNVQIGKTLYSDANSLPSNAIYVTRFRLLELREESALEYFGASISECHGIKISKHCEKLLDRLLEKTRKQADTLMNGFIQDTTSTWQKGQCHSPFSKTSIAAHQSAINAGAAFASLFDSQSQSQALSSTDNEQMTLELSKFIALLKKHRPKEVKQFLTDINITRCVLAECCPELLESISDTGSFEQLQELLDPITLILNNLEA